ncbi:hypothetical protein BCT94_17570 [Vibrio breoganii]|nr:hypothetical protein BCU80_07105 [Vibrio breoganii]PMK23238.1 hypothetical protein BCU06_04300 [Vibrio breoganii]PMK55650.1 hypothetical protein BCT98_10270 [Vibrio breoganii]PMK67125.1 hypothetical protein BCT94_17570 [Vibrio breoganii]PML25782.1 hypothetical protein BCT82_11200 [Vibrio breoganii]
MIVQDGQNLVSRSVDGVANIPDSTKQWWNLVSLTLDAINLSKELELRVMYSFDSNYTSFIFASKKQ